jgi:hypothetical protein
MMLEDEFDRVMHEKKRDLYRGTCQARDCTREAVAEQPDDRIQGNYCRKHYRQLRARLDSEGTLQIVLSQGGPIREKE